MAETAMSQNYINHIALVLDASYSMSGRKDQLIQVADAQIAYLAEQSKTMDQETRITVYTFDDYVKCVIFDKDVLRLPSIASLYQINGNTALIDATMKSQEDLAQTAQMYGDHSFLTFVLTDGQENRSRFYNKFQLSDKLQQLPENWTVAVLVPDMTAKHWAKQMGFPADNIAVWDIHSRDGITEVGKTIRAATDNFMTGRAVGIRGSRSIFSTSADVLNKKTVKAANLKPIAKKSYKVFDVVAAEPIRPFVEAQGLHYSLGVAFYQLSKTESIQPQKKIAVMNRKTGTFYAGTEARDLIGLPAMEVRVKPDYNPDYDVFIQSTSVNRKLVPGTKLLVMI